MPGAVDDFMQLSLVRATKRGFSIEVKVCLLQVVYGCSRSGITFYQNSVCPLIP